MEKFKAAEYKAMVDSSKGMEFIKAIEFLNNLQEQMVAQIGETKNKFQKDALCKAEEYLIDERDRREDANIEDGKKEGDAEVLDDKAPRGTGNRNAGKPNSADKQDKPVEDKKPARIITDGQILRIQEDGLPFPTNVHVVHVSQNKGQICLKDITENSQLNGEMIIVKLSGDFFKGISGGWKAKILD